MMTSGSWRTKARSAVEKVSPIAGLHLRLVDAVDLVFDRILDGEDLARRLVEDRQHGGERRGLAAAGRAGDDDHAVRQHQQLAQDRLVMRREAELADLEQAAVARQQADHGGLAVLRRHDGDADVELGARRRARAPRRPAAGGAPRC